MAKSQIMLRYVFVAFSICLIFLTKVTGKTPGNRMVLPLIHHASIFSPYYEPAIHSINNDDFSPPDDVPISVLVPDYEGAGFLVNVSIGEPPVPQLLVMDTGSALTWVCTNCADDYIPRHPIYDPAKSSTYKELPCSHTYQCDRQGFSFWCGEGSKCSYNISYKDHTNSTGVLAKEKFVFETSDDGLAEIPDVFFGSGVVYIPDKTPKTHGILALGSTSGISLLDHFEGQFSYCIGNISDKSYMFNKLILGGGAISEGASTNLIINDDHYLVNLEGISVGGEELPNIGFNILDNHLLFDSGSTYTTLPRRLYDPLRSKVVKLLDGMLNQVKAVGDDLCYRGNLERDLKGFPTVTFHFSGEADLDLDVEAMFRRVSDDIFCMALDVFEGYNPGILGVLAQQYYNIAFDLQQEQITFQRIDCELFE